MAAYGAHARHASVNEPSGADHGARFELGPLLPEVNIERGQVWRARSHVRSWVSRSFKKRLGAPAGVRWSAVFLPPPARHVCAMARHAMWQIHVVQHPNVAFGVDAHTLFDEARRENDAVYHRGAHRGAWVALAVLVGAHVEIEICLSCRSPVGSNHPNWVVLRGSSVIPVEEFLVREHHARQVQGLQMPFAVDPKHTHALQHVPAKVQSCQADFSRQSRCTDGLEAPRLEIFV